MPKLHIGIVFGGTSSEYDISIRSARNILGLIDYDRFKVIMIFIDKDGVCYRGDIINERSCSSFFDSIFFNVCSCLKYRSVKKVECYGLYMPLNFDKDCHCNIWSRIDVIFPIVHGRLGEDGFLQSILKVQQIPFVGTDVLGSALSFDKDVTKRLLRASGLTVVPFITLRDFDDVLNMNFEYCADVLGLPLFVKPASEGSSIGVSKVFNSVDFYQAINWAFTLDNKVLVESAIVGRELECAVLGNQYPEVSVCGEILLDNSFYTYEKKYLSQEGIQIVIPAKIGTGINEEIRAVVLRVFRVLQCSGMARIDLFLTQDGQIIINEVNTLPGFSATSMYPRLWEASGLNAKDLITILIKLALEMS